MKHPEACIRSTPVDCSNLSIFITLRIFLTRVIEDNTKWQSYELYVEGCLTASSNFTHIC